MRKQYLIFETTQLDVAPPPAPPRARDIAQRAAQLQVDVAPARNPAERPVHDERYFDYNATFIICYSMHDAEEYVENSLVMHPQYKFIIFESVAFLETVASPTIHKMWDANGQLVER